MRLVMAEYQPEYYVYVKRNEPTSIIKASIPITAPFNILASILDILVTGDIRIVKMDR